MYGAGYTNMVVLNVSYFQNLTESKIWSCSVYIVELTFKLPITLVL